MGVDLSDQLIQYFETRKAHKYWKILFFHCIDMCYKCLHFVSREPASRRKKYDHKTFVTELVKDTITPPLLI